MPGNVFLTESKPLRSIDVKGAGKGGVLGVAPAGQATDSTTNSQVVPTSWPPGDVRRLRDGGSVVVRGPWSRLAGRAVVCSTAAS